MRNEPNLRIENYRKYHSSLGLSDPGANWGYFVIGSLRIVSSGGTENNPGAKGWEHVSVSCTDRCPTWQEMAKVKNLFWKDDETVVQFHPQKDKYINYHPYCLHLWRLTNQEFILPPKELIA